jgi:hypothetical protein
VDVTSFEHAGFRVRASGNHLAVYEVPSAASGSAGLEGFSVFAGGRRIGRVAAINRARAGLVMLLDTGDDYRAVPIHFVEGVGLANRTVALTPDGEAQVATSAPVRPATTSIESPTLVRHLPREVDALLREGDAPARPARSRLWLPGIVLALLGGVGIWICAPVFAVGVGGSLRWLWLAMPAALFLVGVALMWRALGAVEGRRPTAREKASDAMSFLLGVSPHTRRRG